MTRESNQNRRIRQTARYNASAPRYVARSHINPADMFGNPSVQGDESLKLSMGDQRRRTASISGSGGTFGPNGTGIQMATGRPRDPMFYWRQNNIPFDFTKPSELRKIREFCNTPDAPIWMGDYSFKPLSEIRVGDEVMGWTYSVGESGGMRKRLTRTKVLATNSRIAPEVVKVTMESGRTIKCTPDHKWANPHFSPGHVADTWRNGWQQPEYRPAAVGQELVRFIDPTEPLTDTKQQMVAQWLSGIYDGEGWGNSIGQDPNHNPDVCQRIKESLDFLGLPNTQTKTAIFIRKAGQGYRTGAQQDLVNFLNWTEPTRKVTKGNDSMILTRPSGGRDKVESIESLGAGEVISMQTETGNYVAWGFASKNCRLLYMTHAVVAACVDIYSKLPLQGMSIKCKDEQLVEFYTDLFLEQLNYEDHLVKMGRQYWLSGECFSIGAWNETLGVWEDEQLINPDDVEVESSLFINQPRYMMRLPESLRTILTERSPAYEYQQLMQEYPELAQYTGTDDLMPVSNHIMYQLKFEADDYSNRGISILMRAFRTLIQEEMLMTALDAIADRLYTPFIVAKLGASATDLGTQAPWIPTADQKAEFSMAMDAALAGDFRVLITHFATDIESLFGRENVPDLTNDFDRIQERILMAFGLSQTMLTGASQGETFAADALNRDVVTQLLTHYQRKLQQFFHARAEIVAEAQEHYDYEVRNGERYLITEEIYEVDEETGEGRIIEQPKLLIPELEFKILNLTDEQAQQEFIESLAMAGIPIPYRFRIQTTGFDFDEMIEISKQEKVMLAVAEQETRKETYKALLAAGLPIPDDLLKDFAPVAMQGPEGGGLVPGSDIHTPTLGDTPQILPNMAPAPEDLNGDQTAEGEQMQDQQVDEQTDPAAQDLPQEGDNVPSESNSERGRMPKPPKKTAALKKLGIRQATAIHYKEPDNSEEKNKSNYIPTGKFGMPKHVGLRRYLYVPDQMKLSKLDEDE